MNVRITPRGWPNRTLVYSGVLQICCDDTVFVLQGKPQHAPVHILKAEVAEIALDGEGAVT